MDPSPLGKADYYSGDILSKGAPQFGFLILQQANFYNDPEKRLDLAKKFVSASMTNMLNVLAYYSKRGKDLENAIESLNSLKDHSVETASIGESMAAEGNFRDLYYKCFDAITDNSSFEFGIETDNHLNRLNALISQEHNPLPQCWEDLPHTHLDPRIGYLHTTNFRSFYQIWMSPRSSNLSL